VTENQKASRNASSACVIFSIIALHELGHAEEAGWVAAFVAGIAFVSIMIMFMAGPAFRFMARRQAADDDCDPEIYATNAEYRMAWDAAMEEKMVDGK
jgi:hypothetical protein